MQGRSIDEALDAPPAPPPAEAPEPERQPWWRRMLTAEPGPGTRDEYLAHPLNWDKSDEAAQLLQGLTGLLGNMRLALLDVVIGAIRILSRRPPAPPAGGSPGVAGA